MSATPTLSARTDGGGGSISLIRCDSESTILDNLASPPWAGQVASETDVIWVTADRTAAEISAAIGTTSPDEMPASVLVISIGDATIPMRGGNVTVQTVPARGNLGHIAEAILDNVQTIESAGHQAVVIIDDLTNVTQDYEPRPIFQFIHLLTARGRTEGWSLQVGLDSTRLDDRVLTGVGKLFDEVV